MFLLDDSLMIFDFLILQSLLYNFFSNESFSFGAASPSLKFLWLDVVGAESLFPLVVRLPLDLLNGKILGRLYRMSFLFRYFLDQ